MFETAINQGDFTMIEFDFKSLQQAEGVVCSDYEDSPSRKNRLHFVLGVVAAKANVELYEINKKVGLLALHDHKGTLSPVWKDPQSFIRYGQFVVDGWTFAFECCHEAYIIGAGGKIVELYWD